MRHLKKRLISVLLVLVTLLTLLPTTALAANSTGTGITPTPNNDRWTTRLTADGQSYAYKPPMAAGKYLYCMDFGYSYRSGTESFLNSYTYWSATNADADQLWKDAVAKTGLGEMDAITRENVKWMMSFIADYTGEIPGSLHMALQTYIWDNQSDKSSGGDPSGDIDAGGFANADTHDTYVGYYNWMLGQKANEDAELQAQVEAYAQQGIQASIVEDDSSKWAVLAISSVSGRQSFFNYHVDRKVVTDDEPLPDDNPPPVAGDGDIVFRKVKAGTTRGLDGAVYNIYRDGQIIGSDVTSGGGYIYVNDVTTALYTFVERESPDGYALDPTPHSVYVDVTDGNKQYTVTASNRELPSLKIIKQDAQTFAEVSAVFEIESITGSYSTTVTVNGSKTLNDLEPGVYRITEKSVEEPYILNATERVVALLPGDGIVEEVFTNYQKPGLEILKRNIADPSEPIPNVTYTIEQIDGDYKTTATTDSRGRIYLELPEGSYEITETSVPSNVILCTVPQTVALGPGESKTVRFFNAYKPSLTIRKVDSITGDPIPHTLFRIVWASDNTTTGQTRDLGTFYTNTQGEIILTDDALLSGWYEVTEEKPITGYAIVGEATQRFYLGPDESAIKVWENRPLSAISVFKYDEKTGAALENAVFQIRYLDGVSGTEGTVIGEYTTSKNGTFTVTGLKSGTYIVEEIQSSPYYSISQGPETVLLTGDEQQVVTLRFGNTPYGSAIIKKMSDDENQTPLEGAVFLVTDEKGTYIGNANGEFTTGRDGTVQLPMVPAGTTLVVREIKAPAGYALSSEPQTAYISAGEVHTFRFFDLPLCNLTVLKRSSVDQSPLEGATFLVKDSEGRPIGPNNGLYQTGRDGTFVVTGLTPNSTIIVSEESAPVGYIRDATPQTIVVRSGEPNGLIFDNDPAQTLVLQKYILGTENEPLEGVGFKVTDGNGGAVGPDVIYYTNAAGEVVLTDLEPGMTVVAHEVSTVEGFVLDGTPQRIQIKAGVGVQHLTFWNQREVSLQIVKESNTGERLEGAEFLVTDANGGAIGSNNGHYTSGKDGCVTVSGLKPGQTVLVSETKAPTGYAKDDQTKSIVIRGDIANELRFVNEPLGNLVIQKYGRKDGKENIPLEGVCFQITFIDGSYVNAEDGQISSKGLYYTDAAGTITLKNIVGSVVISEQKSIPGYTIDEANRTQVIEVNTNDTQIIYFYNDAIGGAEITKYNQDKPSEFISGTEFEIRRAGDDALIDTVTTGADGHVFVPLEDGNYYCLETKASEGFLKTDEPYYFEVKDGGVTQVRVPNKPISQILIHKIDSVTEEGIPSVTFLLYDEDKNPIGQYESDQDGYVLITDLPGAGKYYIRELENKGYNVTKGLKTVYVKSGGTTEIEWENEPITGQIQVYKYAGEYNTVTMTAPGTPLKGAVYEIISARSGKVVDYITTDSRGVAASKALPLGRYLVKEVSGPAYWQVSAEQFDVTLEYAGQIIKVSAYDKAAELGVSITKRGNASVLAGTQMRYDFTVANTSNVPLESFFWHDRIPTDASRPTTLTTGTYSARLNYRILYKTNYSANYQVLASNLITSTNYSFALNAIPMQAGEVVTDVYFDFGTVPVGFQSVANPTLSVMVNGTAVNGYYLTNRADIGGKYLGTWQTAQANWITVIQRLTPLPTLPRTGY